MPLPLPSSCRSYTSPRPAEIHRRLANFNPAPHLPDRHSSVCPPLLSHTHPRPIALARVARVCTARRHSSCADLGQLGLTMLFPELTPPLTRQSTRSTRALCHPSLCCPCAVGPWALDVRTACEAPGVLSAAHRVHSRPHPAWPPGYARPPTWLRHRVLSWPSPRTFSALSAYMTDINSVLRASPLLPTTRATYERLSSMPRPTGLAPRRLASTPHLKLITFRSVSIACLHRHRTT